jgi:hypothetical protein
LIDVWKATSSGIPSIEPSTVLKVGFIAKGVLPYNNTLIIFAESVIQQWAIEDGDVFAPI